MRSRSVVNVVQIENGTKWSSQCRPVIKWSLQLLNYPNREIWFALCVDVIKINLNIKQYGNCTVLLCKRISCLNYKNNIKPNAVLPCHSVSFKFVPSHATVKGNSVTSSTCRLRNAVGTLQVSSFNYVRIKRTIPLQEPYTVLHP